MKAVALSPRVVAAIADLDRAAELLKASPGAIDKAAADVCAALAELWRNGWAPDALSRRDRAILTLAKSASAVLGESTSEEEKGQSA